MNSLPVFLEHLVNETRDYLTDVRKDYIDFKLWFDEDKGCYRSKFSYGRIGEGSKIESVCLAISNALIAIDEGGY